MISKKIAQNLEKASFIRAMFEQGAKLQAQYGVENVFDFSLGNPVIEPPASVKQTYLRLGQDTTGGVHRYMNNAGYPNARQAVSNYIASYSKTEVPPENIVMTCGAGGALNVCLKSMLNPQDEVIIFAPFFVEYIFYIENHGGIPIIAPTDHRFYPDLERLDTLINQKTKAIIINSPNNPTGVIYDAEFLQKMNEKLLSKQKRYGTTIAVLADEPYRTITYDNQIVPCIFDCFDNAISVNSFSKSLAIPGERIGYLAASSRIQNVEKLMDALVFANRTLGFVNAPASAQQVVIDSIMHPIDPGYYQKRRDFFYDALTDLGYVAVKPQGAFYLFVNSPIEDDVQFAKEALAHKLIVVPGSGFGLKGYFRLVFCVPFDMLERSIQAFSKLADAYNL